MARRRPSTRRSALDAALRGSIDVDGAPYTGLGHFAFAFVNPTDQIVWSHSVDLQPPVGVPDAYFSLGVTNGVYSVDLGLSGNPIPPDLFAKNSDLRLRIWFGTPSLPVRVLSPDSMLTSVPYARYSAFARYASQATNATLAKSAESVGSCRQPGHRCAVRRQSLPQCDLLLMPPS